jgi:phosphate transport system substrate-binding protein
MAVDIKRDSTSAGVYPLVLVSYLIGCNDYQDDAIGVLVNAYASYIISEAGQAEAGTSAGSAPVSGATREQAAAIVAAIQ